MTRVLLVVMLLLAALAPAVSAQSGWVEGRLTNGGKAIRYANILLSGTRVGVMGDSAGVFRFRAPCGRHTLRIVAMGYGAMDAPVIVRRDRTTQVLVVMEPVEVRWEVKTPPSQPDADSRGAVRQERRVSPSVDESQLFPGINDWHYPATTDPVRSGEMQFSMRYVLAEQGDSVVVNVIAEGRNVSDHPVTVCGCLSLWNTRYSGGPDDSSQWPLGPAPTPEPGTVFTSLDVPPLECNGARFEEEPRTLLPGEALARGMMFSFYPNAFREHPGELRVCGVFFAGRRGDAWEDTDLIDLGEIRVPIRPIGMPIRP